MNFGVRKIQIRLEALLNAKEMREAEMGAEECDECRLERAPAMQLMELSAILIAGVSIRKAVICDR